MGRGLFVRQVASKFGGGSQWEITPGFIPTDETEVVGDDFHVTELVLTNDTGSDATVTIKDQQDTPIPLIGTAYAVAKNTHVTFQWDGALMVGGFTWSCSAGDTVAAHIRGF